MTDVYERFPVLRELTEGPFSALLGLRVESATEGKVTVRMPFHQRLLNYGPVDVPVHGGAIASLADFAACAAVWTLAATQRSATISLALNYTAPAIQTELVAAAVVRRSGKRVASIAVEIHDSRAVLIADALVTYKIA
ncbi:MAG: PaaI family thioesterase [Deltaproteobacteria bacterium]|nr:PaaI family thioesterase [Deltaproteobacteria bacterium]